MRKTENLVPKNLFPKPNLIDWSKYIEPKKVVHVKVNSAISVAQLIK